MNGFSQPASSQLPPGTWEDGVYDYDDLKKNYIPTYTRYWDDQSKVPFIFNIQKGMWITYDDLQSNTAKNNFIIQKKLLGGMFWEFSGDRSAELIGNTYTALFGGHTPTEPTTTTTATTNGTTTVTTTRTTNATTTTRITKSTTTGTGTTASTTTSGDILPWTVNKLYHVGDRVSYENKIYKCLEEHVSLATWDPADAPSLWQVV